MAPVAIPLDSAIRDWVLLPIIIFVILVTYARLYGMRLLSPPPEGHVPIDLKGVHQRSLIALSQRLRQYGGYISQRGWAMRKASLIGTPDKGLLDGAVKDVNPMANMAGPGSMDMMKMQVRGGLAALGRGGHWGCWGGVGGARCPFLASPLPLLSLSLFCSFLPLSQTRASRLCAHPPDAANGQPVWRRHDCGLLLLGLCHAAPALLPH